MYQKIKQKISDNIEVIMVAAIVTLTVAVVRARPRYVQDVMLAQGGKLVVEFSNGSSNTYSLTD